MPAKEVVANGNNTLTVLLSGDYEINYNLLMNASRSIEARAAVRKNGATINQTRSVHSLYVNEATGISEDARFSASTIVTLQAGDVLDLAIQVITTLPSGLDAVLSGNANATLSVKKLDS